jgi:hypothetical protein
MSRIPCRATALVTARNGECRADSAEISGMSMKSAI